ncbi:hypothetical protein J3Q64DRAFT_1824616 [Phycomyces blakesleeanus]
MPFLLTLLLTFSAVERRLISHATHSYCASFSRELTLAISCYNLSLFLLSSLLISFSSMTLPFLPIQVYQSMLALLFAVSYLEYHGLHHKLLSHSLLHCILPDPFPINSCPICEASTDTPNHFLFSCPLKIDVWSTFWQDVFGSHPTLFILHDAFYNLSFPYTHPSDIHAASLFSCALLAIWQYHWVMVFDNTSFVSFTILSTASRLVAIFKAEKSLDDLACSLAT